MLAACVCALFLAAVFLVAAMVVASCCQMRAGLARPLGESVGRLLKSYGRSDPSQQTTELLVDVVVQIPGVYNPSLHVPEDAGAPPVLLVRSSPDTQDGESELLVGRGDLSVITRAALKRYPHFSRCMDARIFSYRGHLLAAACEQLVSEDGTEESASDSEGPRICMCLLDMRSGQKVRLLCPGNSPAREEKNWIPVPSGTHLFFVHTVHPLRLLRAPLPALGAWPSTLVCADVTVETGAPSGWRGSSVAVSGPKGALLALVHRRLDHHSACPQYEYAFVSLAAYAPHTLKGIGRVFHLEGRAAPSQSLLSAPHRSDPACQFHYLNSVAFTGDQVLFAVGISDENAAVCSAYLADVLPLLPD